MKTCSFGLALVLAASVGGCSEGDGVDRALAKAEIGLADAVQTAREEAGGGFVLEAEFLLEDAGPRFEVEVLDDGEVTGFVIDGVGGTVLDRTTISLSPEEQEVIDAIEALGKEGRIAMPKALKRGAKAVGGGVPIEVDVELQDGAPVFVIVYSVEDGVRETVVPLAKKDGANAPADDG